MRISDWSSDVCSSDLIGAGLLEKQEYFGGEGHIWPRADLFVTFDADFMEWNPEVDARDLAVHLLNLNADKADAGEAGAALDWRPAASTPQLPTSSARELSTLASIGGDANTGCAVFFLEIPQR